MEVYYITLVFGYSSCFVNVALNKPTWQAYPYMVPDSTYDSSYAVDELKSNLRFDGGQCVITADYKRTATWWVNLESVYSILDIRIYYRTDNNVWDERNPFAARFLGFYVYLSNTTNRLDGHLCFHDINYTRSTIPAIANISCPLHAQYVIYFNERLYNIMYPDGYSQFAHNELCEVEVFGCMTGYYGPNCSIPCPENCGDGYCHIETGMCSWCKPGYQGYQCQNECNGNKYGQDCGQGCGACLGYKQCHHMNGSCLEGCDAGFKDTLCNIECSEGYFGYNCENNCNDKCEDPNKCNKTTGECEGGCQAGWKGLQCSEQCDGNRYGKDCGQICGACLGYKQCHHINGSCLEGCDSGFEGYHCTTDRCDTFPYCFEGCSAGKFGKNCSENCSVNCMVPSVCHNVTGECQSGCQPGWEGTHCERVQIEDKQDWQRGFYVILCAFLVSALANVVLISYILLKRQGERRMAEPTTKDMLNDEERKPNDIYENSDRNVTGDYQELGEMEKSSHYDALQ
ncbi:multiple epidermal growth factor-like domains protein 10 isoform X2 [Saccostrea cucullata]|uniref:multiple epidermal growth factor-like domains protein 10 isoform X2 n=1 Tax=Saccostrea cuccullata TaxID=36930 RepID=UPI002ED5D490